VIEIIRRKVLSGALARLAGDPGSGERGGAGHFTLIFTVNFKDFSNFKNVTVNFEDILQMGVGAPRANPPRLIGIVYCILHVYINVASLNQYLQ
jgi:hypothetical protein